MFRKILLGIFLLVVVLAIFGGILGWRYYQRVVAELPPLTSLTNYRPKLPMQIYTADKVLIGEFGEEKRIYVNYDQVPDMLIKAILATEDAEFFNHGGINFRAIVRAAISNIQAGSVKSGASTITMQVARNFLLSNEKTFDRKIREALIAFRIEEELTKAQILSLYINQIFLGQRSYGFASAAKTYFGKGLSELNLNEIAVLAGLPQSPSTYNPVNSVAKAQRRKEYVLRRMNELGFITDEERDEAIKQPIELVKRSDIEIKFPAGYVAESVRKALVSRFGEETVYISGLRVYTTINSRAQLAANRALQSSLINFELKKGFLGPEKQLDLSGFEDVSRLREFLNREISSLEDNELMHPAVVLALDSFENTKEITVYTTEERQIKISGRGLNYVRNYLSRYRNDPERRIRTGSVVRIHKIENYWSVGQYPSAQGALLSLDSKNGSILALVGGFDFDVNRYNRVTQAIRQPGSAFKPFVYSAALNYGITASNLINDAPFSVDTNGGGVWTPQNYSGKDLGLITMRRSLGLSKNLPSARLVLEMGTDYTRNFATNFGFSLEQIPPYYTMSLGAVSVTVWDMARAYSVFSNGGYLVEPFVIDRVENSNGKILLQSSPYIAGFNASKVLDSGNAYIMDSMMRDVVLHGTAQKAKILNRPDVAGKTGTTNDSRDVWFAGYINDLVTVVWNGRDDNKSLGKSVTGSSLPLPTWIEYNRVASELPGYSQVRLMMKPSNVIEVKGAGFKGNSEYYLAGRTTSLISDKLDNLPNAAVVTPANNILF